MKRITLTQQDIEDLSNGLDIRLELSSKRTLTIGTTTELEIKKKALEARFKASLAKLEAQGK